MPEKMHVENYGLDRKRCQLPSIFDVKQSSLKDPWFSRRRALLNVVGGRCRLPV